MFRAGERNRKAKVIRRLLVPGMNRSNDNGLSRAEFEYLYDTDNEEPETNQSEFEDPEEFRRILWRIISRN